MTTSVSIKLWRLAVLLVLGGQVAAQAITDSKWESSTWGFSIERPAEDWTFVETSARPFKLYIMRSDNEGLYGVSVSAAANEGKTATEFVDHAIGSLENEPAYSNFERFDARVGEVDARGLRVDFEKAGRVLRVEARYLIRGNQVLELESWALLDEFTKHEPVLSEVIQSFRLIERDPDALSRERLLELASRCGSELAWAKSWEAASQRAELEQKPIMVFIWAYPGFAISNSAMTETFMEPEIIELVANRYVPFRWQPGKPAPFVPQEDYGLSASAFGRALLVVSADGKVLHETATVHPAWALRFLRDSLAGLPLPEASVPHSLGLAELRQLLHAGELEAAEELVERTLELGHADPGYTEALFWLGVLDGVEGGLTAALPSWRTLADEHPEDRWAWKAAAAMTSTEAEMGYAVQPRWPTEEQLAPLRLISSAPLAPSFSEQAQRDALRWLLDEQREDGGWSGTHEFRIQDGRPDPFVDSAVAIAGIALLDRRSDDEAEAAAERALDFVLKTITASQALEDQVVYMDYTVWSRAWMLWLLSDCISKEFGDAEQLRTSAEWLVQSLASKQRSNGGWSYFYSTNADGSASAGEQSISFVSAMVTHALLRAEAEGIEVPESIRTGALDVLEAMRNENGTFDYMLHVGAQASGGAGVAGAAGRSPLCELALLRGGRSTEERVVRSVDQFLEYSAELSRELGKALMHAGAEGQGCHYLLFDYAFAALALEHLPESARPEASARVRELILDARSEEGAFQDTPINGWSYGTAIALFGLGRMASD